MKKILLPILVACALALPVRGQTILVIDVNGVFNNLTEVRAQLDKMKVAVDQYNNYLTEQAKNLQDLQNKVNALQAESQNQALTQEGRDSLHKNYMEQAASLDSQVTQFKKDQQTSSNIIQNAQTTLIQTELKKIRDQVALVAEKKKAALVLNKSDNGLVTAVAYNDKSLDISTEVQDALNAAAAASAATESSSMPALPATSASSTAPASSAKPTAGSGSSK
jgi:Skp family chaperone for outer membrane proteins